MGFFTSPEHGNTKQLFTIYTFSRLLHCCEAEKDKTYSKIESEDEKQSQQVGFNVLKYIFMKMVSIVDV